MKISLNDCVVIGESNKIFDIMLAYNTYLDNTLDCTKIFIRDLKIVSNVLIIFCD